MSTYNLSNNDREIVDKALTILGEIYDQYGFKDPEEIYRLRYKIKKCSTVQLITDKTKRTFADEA